VRRFGFVVLTWVFVLGACGDDHSGVFRTTSTAATSDTTTSDTTTSDTTTSDTTTYSTAPGGSSTTVTAEGPEDDEDGITISTILPPAGDVIIETGEWGDVFADRVIVRLADESPEAGATVADALGGTVAASIDDFLIVEIELPTGGVAAIAAALEIAANRDDVLIAVASRVVGPVFDVLERPCGPLDSLVLQSEGRSDQYRLIGVEDAWRLVRASGVPTARTTIGVVDGFRKEVGYHGSWVTSVVDAPGQPPGVLDAILADGDFAVKQIEVFGTAEWTSNTAIMNGIRQMAAGGAKVINLSVGGKADAADLALWHTFLQDMAKKYPDVVMVAAAGNGGVDIANNSPGGISEPNLITVGGLDHEGERWYETWIDDKGVEHVAGSNYVASCGEVTLAAISQDVYTGMSAAGEPVTMSGTSFAAPQVTAAAALLKSLDPTLTGAEIKQIIADTAASEIADPAISARVKAVDPAFGGRVLRIDNAVWKVLSERLGVAGTRDQVMGRATLNARGRQAGDDPLGYRIVATAPGGGNTTIVQIAVNGPGSLVPGSDTLTTTENVARWRWLFLSFGDSAQATLTRTDTGACARIVITATEPAPVYAGDYTGTFDWLVAEAGFSTTVPFTATVTDSGTITGEYEWSGVYDFGEGIQADLSLVGSCTGTVGDSGVVTCSGDFMGSSSISGVGVDNPGTFVVDADIDADGNMTGTITASSGYGGSGVFELRGERVAG